MKRTALYARVSTAGQQDNYSFDIQAKDCEGYAQKQADMEITYRFAEVKTGRTLDRVELQKLITLIRNHEVDAVIVGKLDRLSRNVAQLSMIAEICHEEGIELHYADFGIDANTPMGRMIRNMRASYAEFEADIIYDRTQGARGEGMRTRIFGAAPKAPYGHTFEGRGKEKKMVLQPEEAEIIKLIRDWILKDGLGTPTISTRLTKMGVIPPGAGIWNVTKWNPASVYRAITDHSIAGTYYHGRFKRAKRGDKYARPTDPSEWIPFPCEPIISTEEFAAIQKKLTENRELSKRNTKRFYLLGKRIKCKCGRALSGDTYGQPKRRAYRCTGSKFNSNVKCSPIVQVNADRIEQFVWEWLLTQIEPETLRAGLVAERERAEQTIAELTRQMAIYEKQRKELEGRLERIQEGFNGGFYTLDEALLQKAQVAPSIRSVDDELERLQELIREASRSREDDEALMAEAEELYVEAQTVSDDERKRWFLDRLNVRVIVERVGKDYKIDLSCILGATSENSFSNISM